MSEKRSSIAHVVLPVPLRHHFDYLINAGQPLEPGTRVLVPFGKSKQAVGMVIGISESSAVETHRLKRVARILDDHALFDQQHMKLLRWASDYYHYPAGELIFSTLPSLLKQGKPASREQRTVWQLNDNGRQENNGLSARSVKQRLLVTLLKSSTLGLDNAQLDSQVEGWRAPMRSLYEKGLVTRVSVEPASTLTDNLTDIVLNDQQQHALQIIHANLGSNKRILIDGITGSGKTEVYLEAIRAVIAQGKQAMILVPEIGLTPQLIARFRQRVQHHMVVLHSGLSDGERLAAWLQARDGSARIVLGTRSAIWTPLHKPGIFIIDEEHDPSYKQQESFRYSARDIAILRANNENVPVVLGTATPSLETLHNVALGRVERIILGKRATENAVLPEFRIVDIRGQKVSGALSEPMINAIDNVLKQKKQVLLYLNRRGYSPVLMCHSCGWIGKCKRCDVPYTVHKLRNNLICHHCGTQQPVPLTCPDCREGELVNIGYGTERLTEVLHERFPEARILRVDRDSTRRKGSMEQYLDSIRAGETDILVGTQMLAKGHHLPGITLVGIIDADRGLYSADFRASERMAQNIIQVSGRAGRASDPGTVMIQTHFPEHPFLQALTKRDYQTFAQMLMDERRATNLPPFSSLALLRAESFEQKGPLLFLTSARTLLDHKDPTIQIFGPFPAPVEKRAGKFRFQLLVQSDNRPALQKILQSWVRQLDELKEGKKIRWSVDVDPQEML